MGENDAEATDVSLGDPSRHSSETLKLFVSTLGSEREAEVTTLAEADAWRKKRDEWDAWSAEEVVGTKDDARWALVRRTREHKSFKDWYYSLASHTRGWRRTKYRPVRWCVEKGLQPRLLGIDCEMCETDRDARALVGVSVVDESGKVLLKTLVKPPGKIVDMKKEITGLEEKDVLDAKKSLEDVQEAIVKLCKPGTVLVGHSLVYDLKALKIDHQPVIDTALLFRYSNVRKSTPSLAVLCEKFLDRKLRENAAGFHDSVEDAKAALDLALWESRQATPTRELDPPPFSLDPKELSKLFIHRIPRGIEIDVIKGVFEERDRAHITKVEGSHLGASSTLSPPGGKTTTTCYVTFTDETRATEAFNRLEGAVTLDIIGRSQKFRPLTGTSIEVNGKPPVVVVRQNSQNPAAPLVVVEDAKRAAERAPDGEAPRNKKGKRTSAHKRARVSLPGDARR